MVGLKAQHILTVCSQIFTDILLYFGSPPERQVCVDRDVDDSHNRENKH